jgi:F-type H+-transporting ATPase subunit b
MATTTQSVAETVGEAVGTAGHAAQPSGMPQLDFSTFPNQIFWLAVSLVVIYFVLSRIALPRIGGILEDRRGRITADIEAAETLKTRATDAEKAYNQALIDARTEAARIVAAARADIQADLDKAIVKADAEIAARTAESSARIDEIRAGAAASIAEVARDTAQALVAKLGVSSDAKTVMAAVSARMKG